MPLSDIVDVTISNETVVPSRVGFGTPLILGFHTRFGERARLYTSTKGMTDDGFALTDPEYKMAVKILSQNPKVKQFIVGRCANAPTQVENITPIVQNSHTYTVTIDGIEATYASDASATAQEIVEGIATAVNAAMPVDTVIASEDNVKVTLTSEVAGRLFELNVVRADWTRDDVSADPGLVADLQAITIVNDDYYTIHPTFNGTLSAIALAGEVETKKKILLVNSADGDIVAGTGLGADLKALAYVRTVSAYHLLPHEYMTAAWAGKVLPQDPGSSTWKFKTLAGITPDGGFTSAQLAFMRGDNVNFYQTIAGVNMTEEGYSASGEYIDVTQGIDWLSQIIAEDVFSLLASSPKIPYTDIGVAAVENVVRGDMKKAVNVGFLAADPAPVVTVPLVADISIADKAARLLPDVNFSGTLAGAVHKVVITGTVSV